MPSCPPIVLDTRNVDFSAPRPLDELNETGNESGASLSSDGLTLFFSSSRGGNDDIWYATRPDAASAFDDPRALDVANSAQNEPDPSGTRDDLELFFGSSRSGTYEIWRSVRRCP